MSDDELEKLAAEMQNIKPTDAARERGMAAAMAAFDSEFETESVATEASAKEKNLSPDQGLSAAPRPTGQSTGIGSVWTLGRETMTKITDIFSFNGKAAMMVGACAAALFATSLYIPNTRFEEMPKPAPQAVTAEVGALGADTATRDVKVPATVAPTVESSDIGTSDGERSAAPKAAVTEIPVTETPTAELKPSEDISAPAETITDMAMAELPIAEPVAKRPAVEVPAIEVPAGEAPVASEPMIAPPSTSEAEAVLPSDTVVIERRRIKTPARTVERVIPIVTKMQTRRVLKKPGIPTGRTLPAVTKEVSRRVIKTPASTMERTVPAITKEVTGRVKQTDGTFKDVTATVVLQEATTEFISPPPTYETVTETVVVHPAGPEYEPGTAEYETVTETVAVQEASTELVTIPATYETVSETIKIGADGSTTVISSETIGGSEPVAAAPSGGFVASAPAPLAMASVGDGFKVRGSADEDVIIVTGARRAYKSASRRDGRWPAAPAKRASADVADPPAPVTSSYASMEPAPEVETFADLTLEVVPAEFKTVTESVVVQEASTEIVTIPATYETVSEVVLVKPASVEYVTVPATYETVTETIVLQEATTNADGSIVPPVTQTETRRVLKTPAKTLERTVPAVTKLVSRRVVKTPARTTERTKPAAIRTYERQVVAVPSKLYLRDKDGNVVREFESLDAFKTYKATLPKSEAEVLSKIAVVKPPKPEPKPKPQSGLLTAGDYDDVLNPDLYKVYLDKMLQGSLRGKDLPYVDSNNRINIKVIDSAGQPVPMADVKMRTRNNKKMFPLRTGADGMAYLYPGFDGLDRGLKLRVSLNNGKVIKKTVSNKMVREGGDIEVTLDVETAPVKNLDLLLTIDATGSMSDEMRYLQTELKAIVGRVERANPGIDIRTGLVVYRDVGDDYVVREVPFTDNLDEFREALNAQNARGGGDMPEAVHTAMQAGLEMDWRKDALKVNLLVADAPPHDRHIAETWDAGLMSRTKGIHIIPLAASGVDKTAEFLMRSMAQITGGRYLFLTDDSGIGNKHAKPTVDCYVVTRLDELVTRVLSSLIKGERVEPQAGEVIRSVGNYRSGTCAVDQDVIEALPQNVNYQKRR